ncbi:MAG: hypothetical protein ABIO48_03295 [Pedococcus sp.]
MSEPSSSVPGEIADAEVEESSSDGTQPEEEPSTVELEIDQDKLDAWDEVKGNYQVEPDGESVPTTTDADDRGIDDSPEAEADDSPEDEADATQS